MSKRRKNHYSELDDSSKRILIIISSVVFIIILFVVFYFSKQGDNFNNIKKSKSNYLVYTKIEDTVNDYHIVVPYVNIKGDTGSYVNNDIDQFTSSFINNQKSDISYEYNISGDILSIIVKVIDYDIEYSPLIHFNSYNINLKTLELYSNDQLMNLFGIDDYLTVASAVESTFKNYYSDIINEGYYQREECDYDCFLLYRGIDDYLSDISYYVRDGNLIAFKSFQPYSIFGEEEYFTDKSFEIFIKGSSKKE